MNLIKYDNFWNDPLADVDNWMGRILGRGTSLPALFGEGAEEDATRGFRLDSYADDNAYYVVAELPGIPKEDIDVRLENAVLTISGERKISKGDAERSFKFRRSVTLGDDVAQDEVTAKHENGVLTITLPKSEERKPRAITVG